jgi:hypothetical protein
MSTKAKWSEHALPQLVKYAVPTTTNDLLLERKQVAFPATRETYRPGDIIHIDVMSDAGLSGQNSYLKFEFKVNNELNSTTQALGPIGLQLLKEFRLEASGQRLEEIKEVGLLARLTRDMTTSHGYRTGVLQTMGYYDYYESKRVQAVTTVDGNTPVAGTFTEVTSTARSSLADSIALMDGTWKTLIVPASDFSGLFSQPFLLPLHLLGTLKLEIQLALANEALKMSNAANSYEIRNVEFVADLTVFADKLIGAMNDKARKGEVIIPFDTWYNQNCAEITANRASISTQKNVTNVVSVFATFRQTAHITDREQYSFNCLPLNPTFNWQSFQFRVGSRYYPSRPCSSLAEAYVQTQKAWNTFNDNNCEGIGFKQYLAGSFHIGQDVEKDVTSFNTGESIVGGNNVTLEVTGAAPPGVGFTPTLFIHFTQVIKITGRSLVEVLA